MNRARKVARLYAEQREGIDALRSRNRHFRNARRARTSVDSRRQALDALNRDEVRSRARAAGVKNVSSHSKGELVSILVDMGVG